MKTKLKSGLIVLIIAAAMLILTSAVYAVDFKISGQINRAILMGDNGNDSDIKFVDNESSSTRFRFTGSNEFENNLSVGIVWEVQMVSNGSLDPAMDIGENGDALDVTFEERKMEFWVSHTFGKLWLGQGDTASNGTSEVDLSGTDVILYSSVNDMAGAFSFRRDDDNSVVEFISLAYSNFDGLSRRDRIRYDTPNWGGFYASGSYMNGQSWDLAARFARQWEGFGKLAAAIGYTGAETDRDPFTQVNGSISWLHGSGINLTFAAGMRDFDITGRDDATSLYGKVGYMIGKWAFSADYGITEDRVQNGDEADTIGVAAVWNIWQSVQFYGGYRWHSFDRDNVSNINDVNAIMIGGRVKF
jgi:hypothetical protein